MDQRVHYYTVSLFYSFRQNKINFHFQTSVIVLNSIFHKIIATAKVLKIYFDYFLTNMPVNFKILFCFLSREYSASLSLSFSLSLSCSFSSTKFLTFWHYLQIFPAIPRHPSVPPGRWLISFWKRARAANNVNKKMENGRERKRTIPKRKPKKLLSFYSQFFV